MRVLLICHAEDMRGLYEDLDNESSGLTAQGWEQADVLATWLRTHELIDVLVSDNLLQSRLTAQRIGQALGLPVVVRRELPRCAPPSSLTGPEDSPVSRSLATAAAVTDTRLAMELQSLVDALDALFEEQWGKTLALVTCDTNIAGLFCYLAGSHQLQIQIEHTSISEIEFVGDRWHITYINRSPHLPAPVVTPRNTRGETTVQANEFEDLSQVVQVYNGVAKGDLSRKREDDYTRLKHFLDFAKLPPNLRILEIGTGIGLLPLMLAEEGALSVVGIDISPEMLEIAEYLRLSRSGEADARVSYRLAPAHSLPFREAVFDSVAFRMLLHHVRRPERIIRESVRVLKPGGVLVLAELLGADNPVKRATQNAIEERRNPSHVAARGANQYLKLLTDAGLTVQASAEVSFERELEEWLGVYSTDRADASVVREMIEAGLETDAAGINARRQAGKLLFEQRLFYVKAVKP